MPIIGITTSVNEDESILQMNRSYPGAIAQAGGLPVLLPPMEDGAALTFYATMCDGLLLSGGDDVDPSAYGEAQSWHCGTVSPLRDAFELALCRRFLQLKKPILAICRGVQVLNVALGGTLHQDLATDLPGCLAHRQKQRSCYASHPVTLAADSLLAGIYSAEAVAVNSHHHQAVAEPGRGCIIVATAPDGVVEAIEVAGLPFCLGVQWHPERLYDAPGGEHHALLFRAFVDACTPDHP